MQVYLWTGKGRFKVMDRKEVERQAVAIRMTALDGGKRAAGLNGAGLNGAGGAADAGRTNCAAGPASQQDAGTLHDLERAGGLSCPSKTDRCKHLLIAASPCIDLS